MSDDELIKALATLDGYTNLSERWQDCGPSGYNMLEGEKNGRIQSIPNYMSLDALFELRDRLANGDEGFFDAYWDYICDETEALEQGWKNVFVNSKKFLQATARQHAAALAKMMEENQNQDLDSPENEG